MKRSKHIKKIITKNTTVTVTTRSGQPDVITVRTAKDTRLEMSCPGMKLEPIVPSLPPNLNEIFKKMQEQGFIPNP